MKQLTIALDCDGVLFDCNDYVRMMASHVLGRDMPLVSEHHSFDFDTALGLTKPEWSEVASTICHANPTADMEWLPGARTFVCDLLTRGHDVFFLTSHWRGCPRWVTGREARLNHNWPQCDVVFAHNKERAQFDLLLDDKPSTLSAVGDRGVCFDQPWNRNATVNRRVRSYEEFLQLVETVSKHA